MVPKGGLQEICLPEQKLYMWLQELMPGVGMLLRKAFRETLCSAAAALWTGMEEGKKAPRGGL